MKLNKLNNLYNIIYYMEQKQFDPNEQEKDDKELEQQKRSRLEYHRLVNATAKQMKEENNLSMLESSYIYSPSFIDDVKREVEKLNNKNIYRKIFEDVLDSNKITNPLTSQNNDCVLINTKKHKYYIHDYNPEIIINKLKTELQISDDILSKYNNIPKKNCCNVISISLYSTEFDGKVSDYLYSRGVLNKYLPSINRTVKNVKKKLKDWIVRLYLDISVYNIIDDIKTEYPDNILVKTFNEIINSENVEIYTIKCDSFLLRTDEIAKRRTYRFLVLRDPDVNICAIREADGFITNLECNNLKIFAKSDKLFYLPWYMDTVDLIKYPELSYQKWLALYKITTGKDFFKYNQNVYDLLAGMFTTKLKFKDDFYFTTINRVNRKIEKILELPDEELKRKYLTNGYIQEKFNINFDVMNELQYNTFMYQFKKDLKIYLNTGFDEILLLEFYKDIISIPLPIDNNIELALLKQESLFYANKILTFKFDFRQTNSLDILIKELKARKIIRQEFNLDEYKDINLNGLFQGRGDNMSNDIAYIDAIILKDIISEEMFNIVKTFPGRGRTDADSISMLLNTNYNAERFDKIYDNYDNYKQKYLKYKNKYNILKNKLFFK